MTNNQYIMAPDGQICFPLKTVDNVMDDILSRVKLTSPDPQLLEQAQRILVIFKNRVSADLQALENAALKNELNKR